LILQDSGYFCPLNSVLNSGLQRFATWSISDWPIPLRVDHDFALLDLRTVGWIRSSDTPSTSDLFCVDGSGSNGVEEKEGSSPRGSTPARFGGSGLNDEAAPVVSGEDELHDGIRGAEVSSKACSRSSVSYWNGKETRLEVLTAAGASGANCRRRFCMKWSKRWVPGDVRE
jgi:hypothetical protein